MLHLNTGVPLNTNCKQFRGDRQRALLETRNANLQSVASRAEETIDAFLVRSSLSGLSIEGSWAHWKSNQREGTAFVFLLPDSVLKFLENLSCPDVRVKRRHWRLL